MNVREDAQLQQNIHNNFSSLCIFWKKFSLILCLNELILFVDFSSWPFGLSRCLKDIKIKN